MYFVHYWAWTCVVLFWCDTLQWRHIGVMAPQITGNATACTKENIKIRVTCPLWGKSPVHSPIKGLVTRKVFPDHDDVMTKTAQKRRFETNCTTNGNLKFPNYCFHYSDVIMGAMASQITSLTIVYSTVYSCENIKAPRHWSLWPVNSPHKWPVTRKMFPFDDVIMAAIIFLISNCLRWTQIS